jgi:hypothetical protein
MQKISSYLYPNRVELLANLAGFTVEYTNVYQRIVKIYNGIDNTIEFDIKNADQKRIELVTDALATPPRVAVVTGIEMNIMDASGQALPNSPYAVTPHPTLKGIATVTIPQEDLVDLSDQYLTYSVTAAKDGNDVMLYGDSRFGATGKIELIGNAMPTFRNDRVYDTFTAEIDLAGHPIYHSSAIPATFYEAVKTEKLSFDVDLKGFTGSIWLEATKQSTLNTEAWKGAPYIDSYTFEDFTGTWSSPDQTIGDYKYFRISYTTPRFNGVGASFKVDIEDNVYTVSVRAGGTGYAIGSQIKVLGSVMGGVDGINDLIITVDNIDSTGLTSYARSSIIGISTSGTAANGTRTYIVTGTNITGTVDKVTVS